MSTLVFVSLNTHSHILFCTFSLCITDTDRGQKHGMDEFISANPCKFDHASLFRLLQRQTLDHRLNDSYSCLVSAGWKIDIKK